MGWVRVHPHWAAGALGLPSLGRRLPWRQRLSLGARPAGAGPAVPGESNAGAGSCQAQPSALPALAEIWAGDQQDHSPWGHTGPCSQRGPGLLFQGEQRCPDKQGLSPGGGCPVGALRPPGRRCQCPALALKPVPRRAPRFSRPYPRCSAGGGWKRRPQPSPVVGVQSGQGGTR